MNSVTDIRNFNQLFNEYYSRFVRFAYGYVKDFHLAEDFVSEAFAVFWENRESLSPDTKPQAYILTVVKNKCINHLQHLQVRNRVQQEISENAEWKLTLSINTLEACNPDHIFSDEIRKIVDATLGKLPEKTKQIFILSRFQNLTYGEIAEKMNLGTKSIEYHMSKALAKFRIALEDYICLLLLLLLLK